MLVSKELNMCDCQGEKRSKTRGLVTGDNGGSNDSQFVDWTRSHEVVDMFDKLTSDVAERR